jgi:peptidoglycan hydrolase FlgJ
METFLRDFTPHAVWLEGWSGIPAVLMLAVAALETGWGQHVCTHSSQAMEALDIDKDQALAIEEGTTSHNYFGIKATNPYQPYVVCWTHEADGEDRQRIPAKFVRYDRPRESVAHFYAFLHHNPRYMEAMDVRHDPEAMAQGMHEAGYATDPDWAHKVIEIMARNVAPHLEEVMAK